MKSYGQFCPIAKAAELFCERWTPLIVRNLAVGACRFSDIQRGVPLMSPTLLSQRLKQLEAEGIVERRPVAKGRGATYHLTEPGREFVPMIEILGVWGRRWTRRALEDGEIDLGLLIWGLDWSVNGAAFGPKRSVVCLELTDQPPGKTYWWFVNENDAAELCVEDPGHDVDLYLSTTLADMIRIYRGDISLDHAVETERLEVLGSARHRRRLAAWLNLSPLTAVESRLPSDATSGRDLEKTCNPA